MSLHKEISFENDVCKHLAANGWLYAEGDAAHYDRGRAVYAPDVTAWIQATQPKAWETLQKNHGAAAEASVLDRLRKQLDERGKLDLLRHGIELMGLRQPLQLAQFRPALAINPEIQKPNTPPTGCAWCGSCATRCTTKTALTWCCF